jgi:hypothetical protein
VWLITSLPKVSSLAGFYVCLWLGIAIAWGLLRLLTEDPILMPDFYFRSAFTCPLHDNTHAKDMWMSLAWVLSCESHCMNWFHLGSCKASYTNWGFLVFGEQHFWTCPGFICMCDWLLAKVFFPGRVLHMLMARNCNCNRGFKSAGSRPDFDDRFMYFQNEIHAKGYVNVSCMMCFYMSHIVWIVSSWLV